MSSVWRTQHRLFVELFQQLAEWLSDDEPREPAVLEEQLARLLAMALVLLRQHHVNKRGQCPFCGWTRWKWRFWRRRRRCTVHQTVEFAMGQSLDVVWWRLFQSAGRTPNLPEVRTWMAERTANAHVTVPAETAQNNEEDEPVVEFENATNVEN